MAKEQKPKRQAVLIERSVFDELSMVRAQRELRGEKIRTNDLINSILVEYLNKIPE